MAYSEPEIERIARIAFQLARQRRKKLTSVDKANVLDCSRLWREVVNRVGSEFSDVQLSHMYVDSAAMALVSRPTQFDVILTENICSVIFCQIRQEQSWVLLDCCLRPAWAARSGFMGPSTVPAPDIAGQGIANPLGAILSAAMLLRHSFKLEDEAGVNRNCSSRNSG